MFNKFEVLGHFVTIQLRIQKKLKKTIFNNVKSSIRKATNLIWIESVKGRHFYFCMALQKLNFKNDIHRLLGLVRRNIPAKTLTLGQGVLP